MGDDSYITKGLAGIRINETVPADAIDPELAGHAQCHPKKFGDTKIKAVHFAPTPVELEKKLSGSTSSK